MGFADLHIHTIYSYDGTASVPAVLARAKQLCTKRNHGVPRALSVAEWRIMSPAR